MKVNLKLSEKIADELRPDIQAGNVPDLIYLSVGSEGGLTDTMIKENQVVEIFSESFKFKIGRAHV